MEQICGYIHVSSVDQNEIRSASSLNSGVYRQTALIDKMSSKDFPRTPYQGMLKKLKPNDQLCIARLTEWSETMRRL